MPTPLPTRRLGTSGLDITRVGLGAWAIGGGGWLYGWGPQDDADSLRAMRHALECGVNWIDTAAQYGLGHSEELVGGLLRELPVSERPLVFTKCGMVWDPAQPMVDARRDSGPASIQRQAEESLRRLGIERIDLFQIHWPDPQVPMEDSWAAMVRLVEQGKARAVGVSNYDVDMLARCEAIRHVDSLQPPLSLLRREAATEEIAWCATHGTGVIVYSPMQSGLLTDRFTRERVSALAEDDFRRRSPRFQEPALGKSLALRDALVPIARKHGVTVGAVAVAWTLLWPGVSGAIVGARSPEQVDGWVGAGTLRLDDADLDAITTALVATGAGSGPIERPGIPATT